jgi:hypothetical protein
MAIYRINGRTVSREKFLKKRLRSLLSCPSVQAYGEGRPLESLALSVHPAQAAEYNEAARELQITGIGWDSRGRCKITSRGARREWLNRNRLHDQDGGYGDG